MAKKPTYEEFEQKVEALEIKIDGYKKAKQDLLFEKNFSVSLINCLPGVFYLFDEKRKMHRWNENLQKVTEYSSEEISKMSPLDFFEKEDEKLASDAIQEVFIKGKSNVELNLKSKSGKKTPHYFTGLRARRGNVLYLIGMGIDISIYKQVEDTLRESEERYREIVEGTDDLITRVNSEGRFIYLNHVAEKIFGVPKEECIGMLAFDFIHPDDRDRSMLWFSELVTKHQANGTIENRQVNKKTGKIYEMLWVSNFRYDEKGNLMGINCIARDLTDYKPLEAQIQEAQKMEATSTLAGGIAHQFNNALSPIAANIDMLELDFPGEEKIATYTKQMRDSARRMALLTDQLLAYAGGGKYHAKTVSLKDIVRDTLLLIRDTIDPAIQIDTDIPQDVFSIKADMTHIQMALSAVLTNASEAIEGKGRIRVTYKNETITDETAADFPDFKRGDYVRLMIEDDGKGMDEGTRSRIFEPFFTTKFQGRGLGMAAVYGIIKNHEGWILVGSELGKGTTVKIYLPAVETPVKKPKKPKIEPNLIKGTGTILVIEDEEMVMDVIRALLERLGFRVLGAKTGKEAIDIARIFDGDIDLAILDIFLLDMRGKAIYSHIMEARPNLKVIVCSGYSVDGPAHEILKAGAQDFIQKPFNIAELSEKLKKVLEDK